MGVISIRFRDYTESAIWGVNGGSFLEPEDPQDVIEPTLIYR